MNKWIFNYDILWTCFAIAGIPITYTYDHPVKDEYLDHRLHQALNTIRAMVWIRLLPIFSFIAYNLTAFAIIAFYILIGRGMEKAKLR